MDFVTLRLRHKTFVVERAFNLYKPAEMGGAAKKKWVDFLFEGKDIHEMIRCLKNKEALPAPANRACKNSSANAVSLGRVAIIDDDLRYRSDDRKKIWVSLENATDYVWQTTPDEPLFASYHWYDSQGEIYEFDGARTPLPKPVCPGETLNFEVNVIHPVEPGTYYLMVTLVLEGSAWLEDNGLQTARQPVEVQEYDGRGLTRRGREIYNQLLICAK